MASFIASNGRPFRKVAPVMRNQGFAAGLTTGPMWTNGQTAAEYYSTTGEPGGWRMVSYGSIYSSQPAVHAAVNKLYRHIATTPLKVYRKNSQNERERVLDHPLVELLERPTPRFRSLSLKSWIALPLLVHGNALLVKFREDREGPPTEILPVDWRFVSAYAEQGLGVEWWETTQTGEPRYVHRDDALHFFWESPDAIVGLSPLEPLGITVRIEDAAQRHTVASFRNGVKPAAALILHPDAPYDEETRRALRESAKAYHGGDNAGGLFVAGGGADIKTLSFNSQEAQLVEVRRLSREEVAMVYDVAPPALRDFTRATYSNVEEGFADFFRTSLPPWLGLVQDTLQAQLIDTVPEWEGLFAEFDQTDQLKGDPIKRFDSYKTQIESGVMTPAEARKLENRPTEDLPDEAKKLYLPKNNLKAIDAPDEPEAPPTDEPQVPVLT